MVGERHKNIKSFFRVALILFFPLNVIIAVVLYHNVNVVVLIVIFSHSPHSTPLTKSLILKNFFSLLHFITAAYIYVP